MNAAAVPPLEKQINQDLKLIEMSDPTKFRIHVEGDKHYFVHFLNPRVFGKEFVNLHKGDNNFKMIKHEATTCYFFEDTQLRNIETGEEPEQTGRMMAMAQPSSGRASPCTGPIIIPPRHSGA